VASGCQVSQTSKVQSANQKPFLPLSEVVGIWNNFLWQATGRKDRCIFLIEVLDALQLAAGKFIDAFNKLFENTGLPIVFTPVIEDL
jgi:hypothetical protein